jgi:hypothetical protein
MKQILLERLKEGSKTFVLYSSEGCHYCKVVKPQLKEYSQTHQIPTFEIETGKEITEDFSEHFPCDGYPTLYVFENQEYKKYVGATQIENFING